jgi:hypothetical protein
MAMRTFIKVKTTNKSIKGSLHTRYLSERELDPKREEPESRPLFTHEQDGIGFRAADGYLAGRERPQALTNELRHLTIAFNEPDAHELQKLEIALSQVKVEPDESAKIDVDDESANIADSRKPDPRQVRR